MKINFRSVCRHLCAVFLLVIFLSPTLLFAAPKSAKQAGVLVKRWLTYSPNPLNSRMAPVISNIETFKNDVGDPLYYVVHTKPRGFVIVSADDLIEPVIGFFPHAEIFTPSPETPLGALLQKDMLGRMFMARGPQQMGIRGQVTRGALPEDQRKARAKWDLFLTDIPQSDILEAPLPAADIDDIKVHPLVESRWGQGNEAGQNCYNYYTPNHYVCGCVATAMGQLMRFHRYPQAGVGTGQFTIHVDGVQRNARLRGGDGAGGAYDWDHMVLDPNWSITAEQRRAIGSLTSDAGISVNMSYRQRGSGASLLRSEAQLVSTFKYQNSVYGANYQGGFQNMTRVQIEKMINTNLDAGLPVLLGISGRKDGRRFGHAIVADGYGANNATVYHHLNMGWRGFNDGWYNIPVINTTGYNFSSLDSAVYNVYTHGTGEVISGRVVDGAGNPVTGVRVTAVAGGRSYNDTTDNRGIFGIGKVPSNTNFTVTARKAGYTPAPASRNVATTKSVNNGSMRNWSSSGNVWGVNFTVTAGLKGDINGSGAVDLTDAILAMRVIAGINVSSNIEINSTIDIDGDLKIGMAEVIYALRTVAAN